jgi:hypothetical protein
MKEMCLTCYGTGAVNCQVCGGTGIMPDVSLIDEDCLKCKGARVEPCLDCRGTGFIGDDVALPPPASPRSRPPAQRRGQTRPEAA